MKQIGLHLSGKKHVIWDWNGTLINDVDFVVRAVGGLLKEEGLQEITREEYLEKFCFPVIEYYRRLGFDFNKSSFEDLSARFMENYQVGILDCELFSGVKELLAELKENGVKNSVLSAAEQIHLERQLKHYEIHQYFDHVYGLSDHYAHSKLERGKELLDRCGISAAETVLVGDTDHDLEVGKSLGVDVVLLADGHQSYDRLRPIHSRVIINRYH